MGDCISWESQKHCLEEGQGKARPQGWGMGEIGQDAPSAAEPSLVPRDSCKSKSLKAVGRELGIDVEVKRP